MSKRTLAAIILVLGLAVSSAAASAREFEFGQIEIGGIASYGALTISDHFNYDTYGFLTPVIGINAGYEVLPGARLLARYTTNVKSAWKPYTADWVDSEDDVVDPVYTNVGISAAVALTDTIDVVAGWTKFTSGYYYNDTDNDTEVRNVGSGLKIGASISYPLTKALSLDGSYAFIPRVRAVTIEDGDEYTESYVGQGHEVAAGLTYTTGFGLAVNLGFRHELYNGVSDCCTDYRHDLVDFTSGTLGLSYSF